MSKNFDFLLDIIITLPRPSGLVSHPGQHGYTTTINENSIKTTFHILTDQVNRMRKIVLNVIKETFSVVVTVESGKNIYWQF